MVRADNIVLLRDASRDRGEYIEPVAKNTKKNKRKHGVSRLEQRGLKDRAILLVEDNPDDELLMLRALAKNDVAGEVVVARDGVEALDYLFAEGLHAGRAADAMPRLILLDLKLPRLNGFEVLQRVRADERTRLLPVVILTSSRERRDVLEGYGLGANSYVRKPVDFEQFLKVVGQLKLYWLGLNESPLRPA